MSEDKMVYDSHLGGYVTGGDKATISPKLWERIIKDFDIKSVLDIGCGEGHSAKIFKEKGMKVVAIDGSAKVLENPAFEPIIIHDYTKGFYIPYGEFDLAWSAEVLEHIDEEYIPNFMVTFQKAKMVALTHALPGQGGFHHVNEQPDEYWIRVFDKYGFDYLPEKTAEYRANDDGWYFHLSGLVFKRRDI